VTALAAATDSAARAALLEQQASPAEAILGMLRVARERSGDVRRHLLGNGLTPAQLWTDCWTDCWPGDVTARLRQRPGRGSGWGRALAPFRPTS